MKRRNKDPMANHPEDQKISNLTAGNEFDRLAEVVARLRGPDGCPWDREQTHQTLVKYLIEESYELADAIADLELKPGHESEAAFQEELGDVLFQTVLHSQIASDRASFRINDVVKTLTDKMIRRHPHVFEQDSKVKTSDEVLKNWEKIKKQEKPLVAKSVFNLPRTLPALAAAQKIGEKTRRLEFDWQNPQQVFEKLAEEFDELKTELQNPKPNRKRISEELGDLLFSATQLARHLDLDAEDVLRKTNSEFINRFEKMQALIDFKKLKFTELADAEKEKYWKLAKRSFSVSEEIQDWALQNRIPLSFYDSVDSTNSEAKRELASKEIGDALHVYSARHQTAGRGRNTNQWLQAPDHGLLSTWAFKTETPLSPLFAVRMGLLVARSLQKMLGKKLSVVLKPPNDIGFIVEEKFCKLAGLLVEALTQGLQTQIFFGLGINIYSSTQIKSFETQGIGLDEVFAMYGEKLQSTDFRNLLSGIYFGLTDLRNNPLQLQGPLTPSEQTELHAYISGHPDFLGLKQVTKDGDLHLIDRKISWREL